MVVGRVGPGLSNLSSIVTELLLRAWQALSHPYIGTAEPRSHLHDGAGHQALCRLSILVVMGANRKLQQDIDRTLKKVTEGIEVFDQIWDKVRVSLMKPQGPLTAEGLLGPCCRLDLLPLRGYGAACLFRSRPPGSLTSDSSQSPLQCLPDTPPLHLVYACRCMMPIQPCLSRRSLRVTSRRKSKSCSAIETRSRPGMCCQAQQSGHQQHAAPVVTVPSCAML